MTTWLRFDEVHDTGKTKVWDVYNAENGSLLGRVKWHGNWRQYVYDTSTANYGVVWNPDCMDELTAFIRARMAERKHAPKHKQCAQPGCPGRPAEDQMFCAWHLSNGRITEFEWTDRWMGNCD